MTCLGVHTDLSVQTKLVVYRDGSGASLTCLHSSYELGKKKKQYKDQIGLESIVVVDA